METSEQPVKKKPVVTTYGVVALLIVLALLLVFLGSGGHGDPKVLGRAKLANEFNQVQTAVLAYYTEYSEYPVAPDNATLIRKLTGENPRHIEFFTAKASDISAKGELLDPWGTPIQLSVDADGHLLMRSAGPDKTFGTADDIVGK